MPKKINLDGLPADVVSVIEGLQKDLDEAYDAIEELAPMEETIKSSGKSEVEDPEEDEMEDDEMDDDEELEKLMKSNPAVASIINKAKAEAARATQIAKAERDLRLTDEAINKSRNDYTHLSVDHVAFGPIVKSMQEKLSKEEFDVVDTLLKSASEQVVSATLFGQIGTDGYGTVTKAQNRLEALAKQRAAETGVTIEQAQDQLLTERPELYLAHLNEQEV